MRSKPLLILPLLLVGCEKLPPQQEHFERGYKAYNKGDFSTALLYLKPLVEVGNPAAQLLMAKMYSNGDGVPADAGKAELLRNLAAYQVYKKKDLPPGVVRPANSTLKAISDRLDYYVDGANSNAPAQNLPEVLESVGVKDITDLEKETSGEEAVPASVPIDLPQEVKPESSSVEVPIPEAAEVSPVVVSAPPEVIPVMVPKGANSRRSDQISLALVRRAAEGGDPMAMELLSAAYLNGFYGLKPEKTQASLWTKRASVARLRHAVSDESNPEERIPLLQVWIIVTVGLALIGFGVYRWRRIRGA